MERQEQKDLRGQLNRLLKQEEVKWMQGCKDTEIREGDANSRYFQAKANGRRKNMIVSLEQEEGNIEGEDEMMKYITNFYKNLFGKRDISNVKVDIEEVGKISALQAEKLVKEFSMEEIHRVVFSMKHNKSPGPHGFPMEFYQRFWNLIKWDLKAMLDDFHKNNLNLARLNFGIILLQGGEWARCSHTRDQRKKMRDREKNWRRYVWARTLGKG